jgi:2-polyprenyl-3-methyl-5-hydroxy-6-metoxy-1,4-benzoquinol methylase
MLKRSAASNPLIDENRGQRAKTEVDDRKEQTVTKQSRRLIVRSLLALIAALSLNRAHAQAQPSPEEMWQAFLTWLPKAPGPDGPPSALFAVYRDLLIKAGVPSQEASQRVDVLRRMHRERPDGWRVMFNIIYASKNPGYAAEPNALLVSTAEGRKPGRALDIGMGQGRNSVFLAMKGWDVTGFDLSDEGIATARRNAERAGVKINAIRGTEDAFDYGTEQWDLIVFVYEPFPITTSAYVRRLHQSLRAGGLIVVEGFSEDETAKDRPVTAIDPQRLLAVFKDFRLLHYQDAVGVPDWGGPKPRRLVRMVAEKRP